jgi:hypothetical protein
VRAKPTRSKERIVLGGKLFLDEIAAAAFLEGQSKAPGRLPPETLKVIQHSCMTFTVIRLDEPGQSGHMEDFDEPMLGEVELVRRSCKCAEATELLRLWRVWADSS